MPSKNKSKRQYWEKIVSAYFEFCRDKFGESPSFDGSAPRDLGMIVDAIQKKAIEKKLEWTEEMALASLKLFFEECFNDPWIQQNFLLHVLNRQKDKIFFKIKMKRDGINQTSRQQQVPNYKTAGQDIFAERLRDKLGRIK